MPIIKDDIPAPGRRGDKGHTATIRGLRDGQSVWLATTLGAARAYCAYIRRERSGMAGYRFACRSADEGGVEGVRVWLVRVSLVREIAP